MEQKSRLTVRVVEIGGFISAFESLRLPFKLPLRSTPDFSISYDYSDKVGEFINHQTYIDINSEDLKLMSRLVKSGDEHAKCVRSIHVWMEISAPTWFWSEMVTYSVGVTKLPSESTMHVDFKGLSGEELMQAKDNQPRGIIQKRYEMFSYQALRKIYFQRKNHRLPLWREFCELIETLPFSKDLITVK